jgi:uncharacterized membrane protein
MSLVLGKIIIVVLAVIGFLVAYLIWKKKSEPKPFVCPVGFDCHAVVTSKYSTLFGLSLEYWGMLYYSGIALAYSATLLAPEVFTLTFSYVIIGVSTFAFLFSFYLIFIQAFNLRVWCSYCLVSAGLSTAIALLAWFLII